MTSLSLNIHALLDLYSMIVGRSAHGPLQLLHVMVPQKFSLSLVESFPALEKDISLIQRTVAGSLLAEITMGMEHTLSMSLGVHLDLLMMRLMDCATGPGLWKVVDIQGQSLMDMVV